MGNNCSIVVISNIVLEPHFLPLMKYYFHKNVSISTIPYEEYSKTNYHYKIISADFIVVWLNLESLFPNQFNSARPQDIDELVALCNKLYTDLISITTSKIVWFSFDDYYTHLMNVTGHTYHTLVDKLNLALYDTLDNQACFLNLKHLIAEIGIPNAYDFKGKYRWNAPYSRALIEAAVKEIYKQYLIDSGITRKCLVLDCDNVLWGGILSEDGIENLKLCNTGLGRIYQDFQRFVLSLYYHGVILAVCSKNNLSDVLTMFRSHSEMVLREEHIAHFQVNWGDKVNNIRIIADKLNIGLDSMVFIDDSHIEIEMVKAFLPDVIAILFKHDIEYEQFSCFNLAYDVSLSDVVRRNLTYRSNNNREALKLEFTDYSGYLKALKTEMDIHKARPIEYGRISELSLRTNKCTNGKRYVVAEIKERVNFDGVTLYSISVSDRFSDLGIVGAIEVCDDTLCLFSLSCRALGRDIESKMLSYIGEKHKINVIEYQSTGKNEDVRTLLRMAFPNALFTDCENT